MDLEIKANENERIRKHYHRSSLRRQWKWMRSTNKEENLGALIPYEKSKKSGRESKSWSILPHGRVFIMIQDLVKKSPHESSDYSIQQPHNQLQISTICNYQSLQYPLHSYGTTTTITIIYPYGTTTTIYNQLITIILTTHFNMSSLGWLLYG